CEYLHRRLACWPRVAATVLTAMFAGASAVVAWDHREALAALGSSPEDFLEVSWNNFAAARQAIVTGEAFVWSRTTQQVESPAVLPASARASWADAMRLARAVAHGGVRALRTAFSLRVS